MRGPGLWDRVGMVAALYSALKAAHCYGCLAAEGICGKLCLGVPFPPVKRSKVDPDKMALLQAGWQHFTLAWVGIIIFHTDGFLRLHHTERREMHDWQLFPSEVGY